MEKINITKTRITSRNEPIAKTVIVIIERAKAIKGKKAKEQEQSLFRAYINERQSMKKAYAFNKWRKFVISELVK